MHRVTSDADRPRSASGAGHTIEASATLVGAEVRGHVFDPANPDARWVVELLADGLSIGLVRADNYLRSLRVAGMGDGCFGFVFAPGAEVLADASVLDVRLANTGQPVGLPIRLDDGSRPVAPEPLASVRWDGGLRLLGSVAMDDREGTARFKALIDGQVVAEAAATGWVHLEHGGGWSLARSVTLDLPERFADGRVREVHVVASDGVPVDGSPCLVVAFPDGIAAFLDRRVELASETLRARHLDRLLPQSLPMGQFAAWSERFAPPAPEVRTRATIGVILVGLGGIDGSRDSLEAQIGCDWIAACLPDGGVQGAFDPRDLGRVLEGEAAACATTVFALSGTRFLPGALASLDDALSRFPCAVSAYTDVAVTVDGDAWPVFLTAFDRERCLEQGAGALAFAMRREAVHAALAAGADSVFRVFNAPLDTSSEEADLPVHVPGVLARLPVLAQAELTALLRRATDAHLRAKGVPARLALGRGTLLPAVRVGRVAPATRISAIVPTRNRLDRLEPCVEGLRSTVGAIDLEIIVADNGSADPEVVAYLAGAARAGVRVVPAPGPFNIAAINNRAATLATGDHLLFLDDAVEARERGWLDEMLGRAAEPDVGAVGALLMWPSGVVRHGGIALGPGFAAADAFGDRMEGDPGYADLLAVAHECSAVAAACLLTPRRRFHAHGGFDAVRFPLGFYGVDYCLKLRASGDRVVFTPHARLTRREASSRGRDLGPDANARTERELANLRNRWAHVLGADPFYSPMLALDPPPYGGLAWPPRPADPRQRRQPGPVPAG